MKPDFLKFKIFLRPATARSYPTIARALTLAAFVLLIIGGLIVPHVASGMTGTLRNTNLASLIVWSLWWPLVIISAALLGRIWCQVCPMELVNSLAAKIGLKKRVPRFLKEGWGTAIFYVLALLIFIRTLWAHRYPDRLAVFFLFLFGSALVAGLLFEKRAFCTHLCPVGRILGLYACCGALEWRIRDRGVCESCLTKDCVSRRDTAVGAPRGCASDLFPATLKDNRECLVCTQCLKACPSKNFRLSLRRPMSDFFAGLRLGSLEVFLLILVSGLVVWELGEEWSPARKFLEFVPGAINTGLGLSGDAANFVQALVLFVVFPGVLFLVPGVIGQKLNRTTLAASLQSFALLFLPVVALGHAVKAMIRIFSRLPYYPLAFRDPAGYETAQAIAAGDLKIDMRSAEALSPLVSGAAVLILALALGSVWAIGRKSPTLISFAKPGRYSHVAFATLYAAALLLCVALARF